MLTPRVLAGVRHHPHLLVNVLIALLAGYAAALLVTLVLLGRSVLVWYDVFQQIAFFGVLGLALSITLRRIRSLIWGGLTVAAVNLIASWLLNLLFALIANPASLALKVNGGLSAEFVVVGAVSGAAFFGAFVVATTRFAASPLAYVAVGTAIDALGWLSQFPFLLASPPSTDQAAVAAFLTFDALTGILTSQVQFLVLYWLLIRPIQGQVDQADSNDR